MANKALTGTRSLATKSSVVFITTMFSSNEEVEYFVQEVNFPGLTMVHSKPSAGKFPALIQGGVIEYENLSLKLLIDEDFSIWKQIVNKFKFYRDDSDNGKLQKDNPVSLLMLMSPDGTALMKINFYGCKISSIGSIPFTTTESDEQLTADVTIQYDYFEVV